MPSHHLQPKSATPKEKEEICLFAQTNFRNQMIKFGIKTDDRRRHMYVIGKTGMGKTTMMENMVLHDIYNGHGVGIVDPHGDFAEKIIDFIPSHRINDVVYLNPADVQHPIGFNIFEVQTEEQKHLIASGLMATFQKIWPDVWSSRMEYILNNTILALLDCPGSTLLGINRLLADKKYRQKVVRQLKDPVVKSFWVDEFGNYEPRYAKEAVAPIQNKIGQFLSASVIRNMVAQVKSTINIRELMDNKKILVMNLSKGRIGEDNSRLLGGMLINKIQLAAMERVDQPEEERKDFFLYVDEFQNFATPSFANILSEARKYRLSLIMAHQYVAQLDEVVADAVFGNVGTLVTFRIGAADAEMVAKEFAPTFIEEHIVNLSKFNILLKLMIDGVASQPFSATTMPPIGLRTESAEKVIRVSRERYGKDKSIIEQKILKWSGMEHLADGDDDNDSNKNSGNNAGKKNDTKKENTKQEDNKKKNDDNFKHSSSKYNTKTLKKRKNENVDKNENKKKSEPHAPEKTISLSDLKQKKEDKKETLDKTKPQEASSSANREDADQQRKKSEESHEDTREDIKNKLDAFIEHDTKQQSSYDNAQKKDVVQHVSKETSSDKKREGSDVSSGNNDTDSSPKKKRKRKRKRKNKNKQHEQHGVHPEDNDKHQSEKKEEKKPSDESKNDAEGKNDQPKKMNADDIISFD